MRKIEGDRAISLGRYIADTGATVRAAAKVFKISKSTVHKDVTERLEHINAPLFLKIKAELSMSVQPYIR